MKNKNPFFISLFLLIAFIEFFACGRNCSSSRKINEANNSPIEAKDSLQLSSQSNSNYDWVVGRWQITTNEFGLTTLIVNNDNTVIYYGANTDHFQGIFKIEDNVMYCFFDIENIKFPLDKVNQTIDFGGGYYARKVK